MLKVLEKYVAQLIWEVKDDELKEAEKNAKKASMSMADGFQKALSVAKKLTFAIGGMAGSVGALLLLTNKHTAIEANRAEAFGQSAASIDALGYALAGMGIDEERIIDLTKEMNTKIGEFTQLGERSDRMSQAFGQVRDVLTLTGLSLEEIQDLNPADQFEKILGAMQKMDNLQGAQAASKILFGEEGTKIVGYLKTYPDDVQEIINKFKALSLLSDEGRSGAQEFFYEFNKARPVVHTLFQEVAGLTGKALIPLIKEFTNWVLSNRKLIRQKIDLWVHRLTKSVKQALRFLKDVLKIVVPLAEKLYDLRKPLLAIALAFAAVKFAKFIEGLGGIAAIIKSLGAVKFGWIAGITGFFLLVEDIYHGISKGQSIFYDLYQVLSWKDQPAWIKTWKGFIDKTEKVIARIVAFFGGTDPEQLYGKAISADVGPSPSVKTASKRFKGIPAEAVGKGVTTNNSIFNFNVTQKAGEDGGDLSRRLSRMVKKEMQSVFDTSDTGED